MAGIRYPNDHLCALPRISDRLHCRKELPTLGALKTRLRPALANRIAAQFVTHLVPALGLNQAPCLHSAAEKRDGQERCRERFVS
jgi:hypothetical protein